MNGSAVRAVVAKDFALMVEMGANVVRVFTVPPVWLLDMAAAAGLRVLVGIPWSQHITFLDSRKIQNDIIRAVGDAVRGLNRHPAIFESVVVGVPSPLGEEDVKAFVQLRPGVELDARAVFEHCIAGLPFFMVPKFVEFVDEIPKTANQKSQRYLLRQRKGGREYDRDQLGIVVRAP